MSELLQQLQEAAGCRHFLPTLQTLKGREGGDSVNMSSDPMIRQGEDSDTTSIINCVPLKECIQITNESTLHV